MQGGQKPQFLAAFAVAFILSFLTILSQPLGKLDRVWSDIVLTSKKTSLEQKYLIVDITAEDMSQGDGLYVPREQLAQTLERLNEAGADRILFDVALSEKKSSSQDLSLLNAMTKLGPNRLAIPHMSAAKFKEHASLVELNLSTDADGWTRTVRTSGETLGYNPAAWLATGRLSKDNVDIDLRYDPSTIKRIGLGHILERQDIDLSGYHVIISPDNSASSSRIQLPFGDGPDRAAIIALGSQSALAGYQHAAEKSWLTNLSAALIFIIAGICLATFLQNVRLLFLASIAVSFSVVGLNLALINLWGAPGYPIMQFTCFLIGIIVTTAFRLRLFQMFSGLLKGDLSPEEAWAWRAYEDSQFPVILLNSVGNARRMNPAAQQMKSWLGDDFAQKCQADFRQGAKMISIKDETGAEHNFSLEWPNSDVGIIVMRDVTATERKFLELEERAESYEQEKNIAETVSQQKSNFLANMSHELRTPLNAINGFSDIINREVFGPVGDPRYKEFASNILFSGQHLLSLINDILDLSKIEAGKMELNIESIEINKLIAQALQIVNVRAEDAKLKLIYDAVELPQIKADSRAIKQILLNLLTNAIKFTPEGGVVKLIAEAHPSQLVLRVADSGIGISQDDIKRLAQPFQQVGDSSAQKSEGTGLGLSLSKSLVELHGGRFTVESMLGKGTRVSFTLPMEQAQQLEPPAPQQIEQYVEPQAAPLSQTEPSHPHDASQIPPLAQAC